MTKTESVLRQKYGEIMTLEEVSSILRYPSVDAAKKAHYRGKLPVKLAKFPKRQGWFASTADVARCIDFLTVE
ncbi:hypothetical protein MAH1_21280 [Sessilibacter sp. MAH1]